MMRASRIGTCLVIAVLSLTGFQNCAESPTPVVASERDTLQSMSSERSQLAEETARLAGLVAADLACVTDADCEELVLSGACDERVPSSRRRADRAALLLLIAQHRADWRTFAVRAERHPELAWACPQGFPVTTPVCTGGRCALREE